MRIATFNIAKDEGDFPHRIYRLCDELKHKRLDIICLQEDFTSDSFSSSKFLNLELDYNYVSTKTRQKIRNGVLSSSNLTLLSRFDITLVDEIYFDKDGEEERACQFVEVDYYESKMLIANTHLCHLDSKRRQKQIETIIARLEKFPYKYLVLCGDLNATIRSSEIGQIETLGFMQHNQFSTHEDDTILDYIFYKGREITFQNMQVSLKGFSDHHCLIKKFKLI